MKWLDEISYIILILVAIFMAMMPFQPEPHLLEKYHLWQSGNLKLGIDIFDIFWHLLPSLLLLIKLFRASKD